MVDGVGVLRVTGRVGGRGAGFCVDMALEAGIVSDAETHPDQAAHENKGAYNGNEDIQPHVGFGGEAFFLHKLPAAVDDQRQ